MVVLEGWQGWQVPWQGAGGCDGEFLMQEVDELRGG